MWHSQQQWPYGLRVLDPSCPTPTSISGSPLSTRPHGTFSLYLLTSALCPQFRPLLQQTSQSKEALKGSDILAAHPPDQHPTQGRPRMVPMGQGRGSVPQLLQAL